MKKIREMNYENVTIENIENVIKTGYITGLECDGDNKILVIEKTEIKKIEEVFTQLADSFLKAFEAIKGVLIKIFYNLNDILDRNITKKRFVKLLQSENIQRNTINKIIKNNKEKYTYARYLSTLENLERSTYER